MKHRTQENMQIVNRRKYKLNMNKKGALLIEFIVAVALFAIIAGSVGGIVIQSFSTNRLGNEETKAVLLAQEGIEAAISIRNQDFLNLANGDHGLVKTLGYWQFSGSYDDTGNFRRIISIEDGYRLGNGTLVVNGGSIDADTKKITSTVTWNFTPARQNQVVYQIYLTNWNKPISSSSCSTYCTGLGSYTDGICRQNTGQCTNYSEIYESGGDLYCTGGASADTCCCVGAPPTATPTLSVTSTPTPTLTSTPIPTSTPTPTTVPATCSSTCVSNGYGNGICRQNSGKCTQNGEIHLSAGDLYCTGGASADTCCCQ